MVKQLGSVLFSALIALTLVCSAPAAAQARHVTGLLAWGRVLSSAYELMLVEDAR
jgi:hypothetical protein